MNRTGKTSTISRAYVVMPRSRWKNDWGGLREKERFWGVVKKEHWFVVIEIAQNMHQCGLDC